MIRIKSLIKWIRDKFEMDSNVYIIATEDKTEALRITKASDMAICLWELEHNAWRRYKHEEPKEDFVTSFKELINDTYNDYGINTDDLTE